MGTQITSVRMQVRPTRKNCNYGDTKEKLAPNRICLDSLIIEGKVLVLGVPSGLRVAYFDNLKNSSTELKVGSDFK